ncbi:hypothetical protein EVJ58_g4401 [Rhodofomes roseus]|uniref:non-specific serine/threonine protein kinase n=1 Tax=Rhodofomes roseus TaxID=34475 RepID=A0A4Y9YGZ5_9APHY|nr:hypothetical protein EVJ58_g4401 [Rhodofomes roseus]
MDRILHGQSVIGKTSKTTQVDGLRFTDKDLDVVGTLEYGQYGVQCSPQSERDILLQAYKTKAKWAPHLLCAFQSTTHLNLVMDYAEGGTLWDVLESSPHDGKVLESDLRWWSPQIVSAIHWCHSQGFVHRCVTYNFPLGGIVAHKTSRDIKPHNFVLTPTAHLLMIDFGSAAPLLATQSDGSQRVAKHHCLDFIRRLLTDAELRLGRATIDEIQQHPFFSGVDWLHLHEKMKPDDLHTPQFTYTTPLAPAEVTGASSPQDASQSRPFAFSALFQSSPMTNPGVSMNPTLTPSHTQTPSSRSILRDQPSTTFIGFSWGPPKDAFDNQSQRPSPSGPTNADINTPRPLHRLGVPTTPFAPASAIQSTPITSNRYPFATPIRPSMLTPYGTLPRASTIRRTAPRRAVSDREALKQLVDCVGQSARKKVLESGRKPRAVGSLTRFRTASASGGSALKELRFDTSVAVVGSAGVVSYKPDSGPSQSHSTADDTFGASLLSRSGSGSASIGSQELLIPDSEPTTGLGDVDAVEAKPDTDDVELPAAAVEGWRIAESGGFQACVIAAVTLVPCSPSPSVAACGTSSTRET